MTARSAGVRISPALPADRRDINHLLQVAAYNHAHIDWRFPVDWLGQPGFVLARSHGALVGALAATVTPPPAAWLRIVAMRQVSDPPGLLAQMLDPVLAQIRGLGATRLGVLQLHPWLEPWLNGLGFGPGPVDWVETYVKPDLDLPPAPVIAGAVIRPVRAADIPQLAELEAAAFAEPLWRHSAETLRAAWEQTLSFDVLQLDGRLAGFQYSTASQEGAHLVRLTIAPDLQGRGLGTLLLRHAIQGYHLRGLQIVSLNTQRSNVSSQILYGKFGFRPAGYRVAVWVRSLLPGTA